MRQDNQDRSRNNRRRNQEDEGQGLGIINPRAVDNYPGGPMMAAPPAVNNAVRATLPPPSPTTNFGNGVDSTLANPEEVEDMDGICAKKDDPFWVRRRFTRDDSFPELREAMGLPSRHPAPPAFVQQQKPRSQPIPQPQKPVVQQQKSRNHGNNRQEQQNYHHQQAPPVPQKSKGPHPGQVKADSRRKKDNHFQAPNGRNNHEVAPVGGAPKPSNSRLHRQKFDPNFNQKYAGQPRKIETPNFGSFQPPKSNGGGFQPPPNNFRGPPKPHQNFPTNNQSQPQQPRKEFKPSNQGFKPRESTFNPPPRSSFKPPKNMDTGFTPPMAQPLPGYQTKPRKKVGRGREVQQSYASQAIALPGMSSGQPFSSLPRNSKRREQSNTNPIPLPSAHFNERRQPVPPTKTKSRNQETSGWKELTKPAKSGRSEPRNVRNPSNSRGGLDQLSERPGLKSFEQSFGKPSSNRRPVRTPSNSRGQEQQRSERRQPNRSDKSTPVSERQEARNRMNQQRGRTQPKFDEGLDDLMSKTFKSKRKQKSSPTPGYEEGPPPVPPPKAKPNLNQLKQENSHLFDTNPSV